MPKRAARAAVPPADPEAIASARQGGLVYVSDEGPGLTRRRAGSGFRYFDARGHAVRDAATLQRVRALAIPPAYRDVWICPRANGHLQATGRDARGRKQYRYHARWNEVRGREKFGRIEDFGRALPKLRRRLREDLKLAGFPERKVVAIVVAVMADTLVRIGNAGYARDNKSYGLTTLRNRHVSFLRGGRARLKFRGKGGIEHEIELDDARLVKLVRGCQQLPGQHLFQYRDDDGRMHPVGSAQVNEYLHEAMGADFTAKDFRTPGAARSRRSGCSRRCPGTKPAPASARWPRCASRSKPGWRGNWATRRRFAASPTSIRACTRPGNTAGSRARRPACAARGSGKRSR